MSEPFVGEIKMFAGNFAPRGWALCDGQILAVSQNDALFSLFGTIYGGDGRSTFGLPDMRGRFPIHAGSGPGLSTRKLGAKGGAEQVAVSANQIPAHSHRMRCTTEAGNQRSPEGAIPATEAAGVTNVYSDAEPDATMGLSEPTATGGGQAHANLMPFLCVHFIVALFGVYPSRT